MAAVICMTPHMGYPVATTTAGAIRFLLGQASLLTGFGIRSIKTAI
jgi:hypothetical protein